MRGKIKELLFNKGTVILPFSFRKISQQSNKASTEIAYQLLAPKVSVFRRNKVTNSSASTRAIPLVQLQWKPLYLVIYSSLLDLPSHSHGNFAVGDSEKNKTIVIFSSSLSPHEWQTSRANVMSSLQTLNKLPSTRAFSAAEKWTVRSTGGGGFISP